MQTLSAIIWEQFRRSTDGATLVKSAVNFLKENYNGCQLQKKKGRDF